MMMLPLVQDKKKREGKEEKTEGRKEGRKGGREGRKKELEHGTPGGKRHLPIHPKVLKNFISQGVEGGFGLDVSTSTQGSLQTQYQQRCSWTNTQSISVQTCLIQMEREKMQMAPSHKRA